MKRFVAVLLAVTLFTGLSYAAIETIDVESKLISLIKRIKGQTEGAAIAINQYKNDAKGLVQDYPNSVDAADKTRLVTLENKINTAITACQDVTTFIETEWSSMQ